MNKETYSIPSTQSGQFEFQRNAITLLQTNCQQWQIPMDLPNRLIPLQTDYEQKYSVANNRSTQSPAATTARNAAWDALKAGLSSLYNEYLLNNQLISAADKDALQIHYITGGGSPSPAPATTPIINFVAEEISVLHVVYSDSATPGVRAKPANVAFCELICKIGDPAPTDIYECTERYNIPRSHDAVVFAPEQRSKTIYAYARWMNKNGKFGPWSNMVSAIIP
ncbi:hypothetical protein Palpr_2965 [Paludibacter propionicigenes WB4]|uniref:Uncharacterized protein n=1 Tax=Paludibacter propionicigenes (strain DSM 17365 / JCM 13257 / WB4) TaxID=694427 RepID=E4T0N0_PALPW|nr:hypothetical protein [Paludibacter propionicigenes]ADQ81094.1 hypothetical protein Palpr_2965 [Paludibacter propionicigenes WB4]